jgi:membrane protease YdiL (CAAX protease family)
MRPVCLLLIYISIVFLGAALIAPWVFLFCQFAGSHNSLFQFLAEFPFHRFVNRSLLFLTLLGLWPFLRSLGICSWKELGFAPLKSHWKKSVSGFFLGFCSLAAVAMIVILFGARTIDLRHAGISLAADLLGATLAAIAVATLEETLFRGALFGALRKTNPWPFALVISSAIYALLHFFAKPESPAVIQWNSGLIILSSMFRGFADFKMLVPGFFNLFIVGVILGFVFQRTGNLYFSIGLHAGWIFWLKSYGLLTDRVARMDFGIWGSGKIIDGWLATAVLLFVFGILLARSETQKRALDVA